MYSSVFYMSAHRKTEWSTTLILSVQTPESVTRVKKSVSYSNLNLDIVISINLDNQAQSNNRPVLDSDVGGPYSARLSHSSTQAVVIRKTRDAVWKSRFPPNPRYGFGLTFSYRAAPRPSRTRPSDRPCLGPLPAEKRVTSSSNGRVASSSLSQERVAQLWHLLHSCSCFLVWSQLCEGRENIISYILIQNFFTISKTLS